MTTLRLHYDPAVHPAGFQTMCPVKVDEFVSGKLPGHSFVTESLTDSESLIEVAGRTCYMSFKGGRKHKAYIDNIIQSGHGCYDIETDVLTSSGWKRWPDVTKGDELATLNIETGNVEYQKPIRLIEYEYSGKMYYVDSRQVNLLVTPNHRMYACRMTTNEGRKRENYSLIEAESLGHSAHCYAKSGRWGQEKDAFGGADVTALVGFAIGDGSGSGKRKVKFHLRRERKIVWLRNLISRLENDGFSLSESLWHDRYTVSLPEDGRYDDMFLSIYNDAREKVIPSGMLTKSSMKEQVGLLDGLIQSDGSVGRTSTSFYTTSQTLADQVQQLCMHVGLAANVCYTLTAAERPTSYGDKPLTRLTIVGSSLKPEVNKYVGQEGKTSWVEGWSGSVFCAEVPNGTLYVRRNGRPVWSGNSVLEHGVVSLIFSQISRSLSHELVRHRIGWSYSQLSQRYVDSSDVAFCVPPAIAPYVKEYIASGFVGAYSDWFVANGWSEQREDRWRCGKLWLDNRANELKEYAWLTNSLSLNAPEEMEATEKRKWARQAARSGLPNATETIVFVTANYRALRHFIEMRCSRHADVEIRKLAGLVYETMLSLAPAVFGDYAKVELADGSFEVVTPNRKV